MWVVVGGYFNPNAVGKIFTSTNGTNWTRSQINFRKRFRDITFGNGQFVAVGNDGIISVFSGSQVYTNVTSSGDNLRRVRFANGRFFAVGNGGTIISTATPENRASWVIHRVPTGQNFHDIVLQPSGRAVVVGNNGMVLHSGRMTPQLFLRAAAPGAILQTEPGIDPSGLVLERSADFKTWETIPGFIDGMSIPTADSKNFFRLVAP